MTTLSRCTRLVRLVIACGFCALLTGADSSGGAGSSPPQPPPVKRHVLLGVTVAKGDPSTLQLLQPAVIGTIQPGSTADAMGLRVQDLITALNSKSIGSWSDVISALSAMSPGDIIVITVTRGAKSITLSGTLQARPDHSGDAATPPAASEPPP